MWINGEIPEEPKGTYIVFGEFAYRFAIAQGWKFEDHRTNNLVQLSGEYKPRIEGELTLPMKIWILEAIEEDQDKWILEGF